jgi:hypothetical protein
MRFRLCAHSQDQNRDFLQSGLYLMVFIPAAVYPLFSRDIFSGLAAVMLGLAMD